MAQESILRIDSPVLLAAGIPTCLLVAVVYSMFFSAAQQDNRVHYIQNTFNNTFEHNGTAFPYDRNMPLIFIGGMPRSGTTLMRAILDAHSMARCGEETHLVPRILSFREGFYSGPAERELLVGAGLNEDTMRSAFASFILEMIVRHGEPAARICNKDPYLMRYAGFLSEIFPKSKYLYVMRDGRAVVHSIMTRKIYIKGIDRDDYRSCLTKWNSATEDMLKQCQQVGPDRCLIVYYEQLVAHPSVWIKYVADFLDIPWEDAFLNHEAHIGKPGGISVSPTESSTDQIMQPIHGEALSKWVGNVPKDMASQMAALAPMLQTFGYSPDSRQADYRCPKDVNASATEECLADLEGPQKSWFIYGRNLLSVPSPL